MLKGLFKDCKEARETSQWVAAVTGEGPNGPSLRLRQMGRRREDSGTPEEEVIECDD